MGAGSPSFRFHESFRNGIEICMEDFFADFPVVVERPIYWGEMDAFQHVNNTVYFRYFEEARIAYFEKLGLTQTKRMTGIGPILASTYCNFRIPLTHPDVVSVGSRVTKLAADRFTMEYIVVSRRLEKVAAKGEGVLVAYDYRNSKKSTIPEEVKTLILDLEKGRCSLESDEK